MRSTCRSHAGCVVKVGGWLPALCSHHGRHPPCAVHRFSPVLQAVAKSTPTLQRRCRRQTACSAAPAAPAAQSGPQPAEDVPAAPAQAEGPGSRGGPDSADAVTVSEEKLPQSHVRLTVTVPPAFVRKCYDKGVKQLRAKTPVPGFRPGKKVHDAQTLLGTPHPLASFAGIDQRWPSRRQDPSTFIFCMHPPPCVSCPAMLPMA